MTTDLEPSTGSFEVMLALLGSFDHFRRQSRCLSTVKPIAVGGNTTLEFVQEGDLARFLVDHAIHVVETDVL